MENQTQHKNKTSILVNLSLIFSIFGTVLVIIFALLAFFSNDFVLVRFLEDNSFFLFPGGNYGPIFLFSGLILALIAIVYSTVRRQRIIGKRKLTASFLLLIISSIFICLFITLNTPRDGKGSIESHIKGNIDGSRILAELYFDSYNSYGGACTSANFIRIEKDIRAIGGSWHCYDAAAAYCARSVLPNGGFYCADSTNYSGPIANCSASHFSCQ